MSDSTIKKNGLIIKMINDDNIYEYEDLIPPDVAEQILREHHKGVVAHDESTKEVQAIFMCAVTGVGWDGDVKSLVIEWVYVVSDEAFDTLLEYLIKEASAEEVKKIRMELPITDEHTKKLLEKNSFDMKSSESLLLETNVDEIIKIKQFQGNVRGDVVSLDDLFTREFRRALTNFIFHGARGLLEDAETLPMSWFDLELSCCIRTGDRVTGMFLVKKTTTGVIVPVLMFAFEPDAAVKLMMLLRFFVQNAEMTENGDTRVVICRYNKKIRALTDKLLPGKKGDTVYFCERDI